MTAHSSAPIAWASDALRDVAAERRRQIEVEGWTPEHDDAEHLPGEMALAACCYCVADEDEAPPAVWPWANGWWKPKDRRRNMVRAAALLLAEIERLDRSGPANDNCSPAAIYGCGGDPLDDDRAAGQRQAG